MKDRISKSALLDLDARVEGSGNNVRMYLELPFTFSLDSYFSDTEIKIIKSQSKSIGLWNRLFEKCPICGSRKINKFYPHHVFENDGFQMQYTKFCTKCHWASSTPSEWLILGSSYYTGRYARKIKRIVENKHDTKYGRLADVKPNARNEYYENFLGRR